MSVLPRDDARKRAELGQSGGGGDKRSDNGLKRAGANWDARAYQESSLGFGFLGVTRAYKTV